MAELVDADRVVHPDIHPLWPEMPRVVGPAHAVRCAPGDQLMLHAAIHRAEPGSVLVVESGGSTLAVAGGNVCAVAHRRGIAGLVVDGYIRDLGEVRDLGFPVFARGVFPKPGAKQHVLPSGRATVGGVQVVTGDAVIADQEGIVVVAGQDAASVFATAASRAQQESEQDLDQWEARHRQRITAALEAAGDSSGLSSGGA